MILNFWVARPVLVTGLTSTGLACSTHDPQLDQLNIALATRLHYKELPKSTHEELTVRLPITRSISIDQIMVLFEAANPHKSQASAHYKRGHQLAANIPLGADEGLVDS
jgi:hypothetical protein